MFRDRCLAARMAAEDLLIPAHALARRGHIIIDGLGAVVAETLLKYQIRDGQALKRFETRRRVSMDRLGRAPSEAHARSRAALDRLVAYYFRRVANLGGVELFPLRRVAEPRSLYIDDFEPAYGYTTLGFRIHGATYKGVTRIWKRQYRSRRLIIDLPWERTMVERELGGKVVENLLFLRPSKQSAFRTRVANVGRIAADALAESLGRGIRAGLFDQPRSNLKEKA